MSGPARARGPVTPGPGAAVVAAVEAGESTRSGIARRTGLDPQLVDVVIEQLQRMGRLEAQQLSAGCPSGGCRACDDACPTGGDASGPAPRTGPPGATRDTTRRALTVLTLRPRKPHG